MKLVADKLVKAWLSLELTDTNGEVIRVGDSVTIERKSGVYTITHLDLTNGMVSLSNGEQHSWMELTKQP